MYMYVQMQEGVGMLVQLSQTKDTMLQKRMALAALISQRKRSGHIKILMGYPHTHFIGYTRLDQSTNI